MICPYCNLAINLDVKGTNIINCTWDDIDDHEGSGFELKHGSCPSCDELIIILTEGRIRFFGNYSSMIEHRKESLIYPRSKSFKSLPAEVDGIYRNDFLEAYYVLDISPKASAAISRRLLQHILRNKLNIKAKDLNKEIEILIERSDIPSYIIESVDAIRNVGNFAAHPMKSSSTGEILDVEQGEAEWLLEVLEALFDFCIIQPKRLEERRNALNKKLQEIGKPLMK